MIRKFNLKKVVPIFLLLSAFTVTSGFGQTSFSVLKGKVIESNKKKPLEFATVSVFSVADSSLIKGTITNRRGEFEIDELTGNDYFLKVEYLGYKSYQSEKLALGKNEKKQLKSPIPLTVDTKSLSEVTINGERDFERVELDRTVYSVANSPVADGGTINDVLSTIPRMDVNADGELSFRGSTNVKVLIDGKLSGIIGLTPGEVLRNMPASDVDRVEIITSPSAKYEASGSSGIVNIIMKKERVKGFNGNASASLGTKDKHSGSVSLNQRSGKLNFIGNFSYINDWNGRDSYTDRIYATTATIMGSQQDADVEVGNRSFIGKLGLDYLINDKNTWSFAVTRKGIKQNWNGLYSYADFDMASSANRTLSSRETAVDVDLESMVYSTSYIRKFNKKGQEFSIDVAYTDNSAENKGSYDNFDAMGWISRSNDFFESDRKEAVVQADYVHPLGKSGKLETGYMYRSNDINYKDMVALSKFDYKEQVQGLYLQYSGKKGKVGYQLGLRSEYTDISTSLNNDDDYFDFFPSLSFSYQLGSNKQLSLSYSKAVYRPNSGMLNPFQNVKDPANQKLGNQNLDAYYTHKPELTFVYKRKKITYTTNLYYYYYDNLITQYRSVDGNTGQATVTYLNLDNKHYAGIDFNTSFKLNKWWSVATAMSGVYEKYAAINGIQDSREEYLFHGKLTSTMRIPKFLTFQATCRYQESRPILQGKDDNLWYLDLVFAKRIMKGRATVSLRVYDVFDTKKFKVYTNGQNFNQYVKYNYESRMANFTFRYYFGKKYSILRSKEKKSTSSHFEKEI